MRNKNTGIGGEETRKPEGNQIGKGVLGGVDYVESAWFIVGLAGRLLTAGMDGFEATEDAWTGEYIYAYTLYV